jgi:hypothetical protein
VEIGAHPIGGRHVEHGPVERRAHIGVVGEGMFGIRSPAEHAVIQAHHAGDLAVAP